MVVLAWALPLIVGITTAQHVDLEIPQTKTYVSSMLSRFSHYTKYAGPTAGAPKPTVTPKFEIPNVAETGCSYWMEDIKHQGVAAFNDAGYTVFRNVKDYGAKGDGSTDDTSAINAAISDGNRIGPASGVQSSTNTPAVVYFPSGTYIVSTPIIDFYYTQLIGNPNCMPVIKATSGFTGFGLIDGDAYQPSGDLGFQATGVFWRQIRNFVIDLTAIPGTSAATGIHWPTSQATSLQNIVFEMSAVTGTQHQGVFIESGSGGFVTDLVFNGGLYGMNQGNQQFTMRNLTFNNAVVAISQIWDWGWTYKGLNINNCQVGLNMSSGGSGDQSVAAVVMIDSTIANTPTGILTAHSDNSSPAGSGSLILENVQFNNVDTAVKGIDGSTKLAGGTKKVAAWAEGHEYNPSGPKDIESSITPNNRPASLLEGPIFRHRHKPQYREAPLTRFVSVRSQGAKGDGTTDDTAAVQKAINAAAAKNQITFFDAGTYKVTSTIDVPAHSKLVGESYSVIMSSGKFFNDESKPQPVVRVGQPGASGHVEWSDMIVSTQGPQAGAVLIEWNIASPSNHPSGMWDVHARIGGFIGSNLQGNKCPAQNKTTITEANYKRDCVGAYLTMHVTPEASGLYMENVWLWTADHDVDNNYGGNQITIYTGRGFLSESKTGNIWMYGTAVEHHSKYQYQFVNTQNTVVGQIQTETPYYQPNPNATIPFSRNTALHDPTFPTSPYTTSNGTDVPNAEAWGLRVINSDILVYGAGLYSFFTTYSTHCSDQGQDSVCQSRILSLEQNSNVPMYDLHTVGTRVMIRSNGKDVADWSENQAGFSEELAIFKPGA